MTVPAVRTPEERFEGLPGPAFRPSYREALGLRLAHLAEGAGPPVLFLHGEPTWSFLWREVLPPVLDADFRCLAPDLPGFGRWTSQSTCGALVQGQKYGGRATLLEHTFASVRGGSGRWQPNLDPTLDGAWWCVGPSTTADGERTVKSS